MTTRRTFLALGGAAVLAGCREPATPASPAAPAGDLLVAQTRTDLVLLRGTTPTVVRGGVTTAGPGRVFAATPAGDRATALSTVDAATGRAGRAIRLDGRWTARLTSPEGRLVVLTPPDEPAGRTRSAFLIADADGEVDRFTLTGNLVPDAFGVDGQCLFLLDWLPPEAPDRYRVRVLDFSVGVPQPLSTRDKLPVPAGAEEEMRGDGRHSVSAPDRTVLYTLYTHQPDHQHTRDLTAGRPASGAHAFVHCLNLEQRWAYCLDLPDPFGHAAPDGYAIAVSRSGSRLVVVDVVAGRLALADTSSLTVQAVAALPAGTGPASAAVHPDGTILYVGAGSRVHVVRLDGAAVLGSWQLPAGIRGLAVSADGRRLAVGQPDAVTWLDTATGQASRPVRVPGLTAVREIR